MQKNNISVVCYFDDVVTSGGYFFSSCADFIVANPLCLTGSIGVFSPDENVPKYSKITEIKENTIKEVAKNLDKEKLENVQNMVDYCYDHFLQVVSEGRKMKKVDVESISGENFCLGSLAFQKNLVDKVGSFIDSVNLAGHFAKMKKSNPLKMRNQNKKPRIIHFHLNPTQTFNPFFYPNEYTVHPSFYPPFDSCDLPVQLYYLPSFLF